MAGCKRAPRIVALALPIVIAFACNPHRSDEEVASHRARAAARELGECRGAPRQIHIYLIGDSTMSEYGPERYPRMGWGQPLGELFAPACAQVVDRAISGRSSKSFYDEGAWAPVRDALESGDFVLIQFGHNDEKSEDPRRFTEPATSYKEYLTIYVDDTRARYATPILLTSIQRNEWQAAALKDTHGAYPAAVRELAHSLGVELIDLSLLSKAYLERIGPLASSQLFMNLLPGEFPNYANGNRDDTHLRESGARLIGRMAMADAYAQDLPLAAYLRAVPTAP